MDIVTGKCDWSYGFRYEENHVDDLPVLYWFELRRLPGSDYKVEWQTGRADGQQNGHIRLHQRRSEGEEITLKGRPPLRLPF